MKKRVKIILGVIVFAAAVAAGLYYIMQPLSVEAVIVNPKDALLYLTEHGYVESSRDYELYAEVSGKVMQTYVTKDSLVSVGDLLLELDASALETERQSRLALIQSYEAQISIARQSELDQKEEYAVSIKRLREEINSIEGQRKNAEARRGEAPSMDEQIRLLELSIEQKELQISFARSQLQDLRLFSEQGIIPRIEVTSAEQELALLENSLASLQEQRRARLADRDKAKTEEEKLTLSKEGDQEYYNALTNSVITQIYAFESKLSKNSAQGMIDYYSALIQSELAILSGINPDKYRLVSPIDGIISDFPAENQSLLSSQTPAAVIRPLGPEAGQKIVAYVSTRDIASLAVGQQVSLIRKLRDGDMIFTGRICDIATRAEIRLSALGIDERRVKVSIIPDSTVSDLYEGYDVDVRFSLIDQKDKLLVPSSAIFKNNGQDSVFTIVNNIATVTAVKTGIKTGSETVLEEGIQPGAIVVRDPNIEGLRDGSKIQVVNDR